MKNLLFLLIATACFAQPADWATPAEKSNYRTTPRYDETMAYVRRVAAAAPSQVKVFTFGQTGEGRDLVAVAVSSDGVFDPQKLHAAGRPIVLIQNAIHAGEMDGKDSCLALLRDMVITKTRAGLLERAVPVIIPIYNADGHERFGPFNRINQNGPDEMGWRVDAENLNLNRDYVKADAAVIAAGKAPGNDFALRSEASKEMASLLYRGYRFTNTPSEVSGESWIQYTHEPMNIRVPRPARLEPSYSVAIPRAYIVPREWDHVIEVLQAQGVRMLRTTAPWSGEVETYRCHDLKWQAHPFEGRHPLSTSNFGDDRFAGQCSVVREKLAFAAGSVVVPMDQRAAKVAIEWLEPMAPDSAVVWGFFDPIFEQKEYAEDYVLEKLARDMMAKDPALKQEFENKLASDKAFAASPRARLGFFYQRSPWYAAQRVGLYPVGRLSTLDGVPLQ